MKTVNYILSAAQLAVTAIYFIGDISLTDWLVSALFILNLHQFFKYRTDMKVFRNNESFMRKEYDYVENQNNNLKRWLKEYEDEIKKMSFKINELTTTASTEETVPVKKTRKPRVKKSE